MLSTVSPNSRPRRLGPSLTRALACTALLLVLLPGTSAADTPALPQHWPLVGKAQLSVLWWDIYEARLFSPGGRPAPTPERAQEPLLLELTYQRDIPAGQLLRETERQLQPFSSQEQRQRWLPQLQRLWPDVQRGDRLSLLSDRQGSAHFYVNGAALGSIREPAFTTAFLSIWLAPESQYPEQARALRGAHHGNHP